MSKYVHYYLLHQFNERATGYLFAQWSWDDYLTGILSGEEYRRQIYGARLRYQATERVSADTGLLYEERENTVDPDEYDRWIFTAGLTSRLTPYTTGYLRYRYEESDLFDESLYRAGIRHVY